MIYAAVLIVLLAAALAALVVSAMRSRRHSRRAQSGVTSFRRHIDALSPEARREVMDRVRKHSDETEDS
jgi:hypothetical protein